MHESVPKIQILLNDLDIFLSKLPVYTLCPPSRSGKYLMRLINLYQTAHQEKGGGRYLPAWCY